MFNFGYQFEPPCPPEHPQYRQLTVVLRPQPTHQHFDPEAMQLTSIVGKRLEALTLSHLWPGINTTYQVGAGCVILRDRIGKKIEAFTFGGKLDVEATPQRTVCNLRSPVPIFPLLQANTLAYQLGVEMQILFAHARATWDMRHPAPTFDERLGHLNILDLYRACLASLLAQRQTWPVHYAPWEHIEHFVDAEQQVWATAHLWPPQVLALEALLETE